MKIVAAIVAFLFGYLVVCSIYFMKIDKLFIVDSYSMILIYLLVGILILLLYSHNVISLPLLIILTVYVFQKYCLGTLYVMLLPEYGRTWYVQQYSELSSHDLNVSLAYSIIGTIATGGAVALGTLGSSMKSEFLKLSFQGNRKNVVVISPASLFVLFVVIAAVNGYLFFVLGIGRHYSESTDSGFNWLNIFRNTSIFMYLVFGMLFFGWESLKKSERNLLIFILVFMALMSVVSGSRGFVYVWLMLALFVMATKESNFTVRIKTAIYMGLLGVVAVVSYPVGLAFRQAGRDLVFSAEGILYQLEYYYLKVDDYYTVITTILFDVINRLTELQPSMRILGDKQVNPPEEQISIFLEIERFINALVPGDIFPNVLPSNQLFDYIYLGERTNYNTQEWGAMEFSYVLFGSLGGAVALFIIVFLMVRVWRNVLMKRVPLKPIVIVFFLFWFWHFLRNMGYSLWLSALATELIVFAFYLILLKHIIPMGLDLFSLSKKPKRFAAEGY